MSAIEQRHIPLPSKRDQGKLAFVLLNVFTEEECKELVELTEKKG